MSEHSSADEIADNQAKVALGEMRDLRARIAELTRENMCDACAGTGKPVSGLECMCRGTGKMSEAARYLRERAANEPKGPQLTLTMCVCGHFEELHDANGKCANEYCGCRKYEAGSRLMLHTEPGQSLETKPSELKRLRSIAERLLALNDEPGNCAVIRSDWWDRSKATWDELRNILRGAHETCGYCHGNDRDAPCAYPSEGKPGCLRDLRLSKSEEGHR